MRSASGSPRPSAAKAVCMAATIWCWLSTSVPSQSKMTRLGASIPAEAVFIEPESHVRRTGSTGAGGTRPSLPVLHGLPAVGFRLVLPGGVLARIAFAPVGLFEVGLLLVRPAVGFPGTRPCLSRAIFHQRGGRPCRAADPRLCRRCRLRLG